MSCIQQVGTADFFIGKNVHTAPLHNMHSHHSFEIYCLVKGSREYFIEDRFFMVQEGDVVLVPRKVFHRTAGEGGMRFLVHFSEAFLRQFFTEAALAPILNGLPVVFRGEDRERNHILFILNTLLTEYSRCEREQLPQNESLLAGYLFQLLFTMVYSKNTYVPHNNEDVRITEIVQYINENYNSINEIEQIAEHFYISKYHLCRYFRKKLGVQLVAYLNAIKIREACNLIKSGCSNMTQVAMQCGFNSSSYFCKVFKKEKGISPSEYRKNRKRIQDQK